MVEFSLQLESLIWIPKTGAELSSKPSSWQHGVKKRAIHGLSRTVHV